MRVGLGSSETCFPSSILCFPLTSCSCPLLLLRLIPILTPPFFPALPHSYGYFNNIAVAVRCALEAGSAQRILVVDWSLRHGQGLQHIFSDDPRVIVVSLHRYDNGLFPPHTGAVKDIGVGGAAHHNVNIAWRGERGVPAMGDADYFAAFRTVVLPLATEFCPNLVVVSAGFDACSAQEDNKRTGGYSVSPLAYAYMTQMLMGVAEGRVVLALEQGYVERASAYLR